MDIWVKKSQDYLNATYADVGDVPWLNADGYSGWLTMFALTRALQEELGIESKSDTFGPTTLSQLSSKVGDVKESTAKSHPRIFALLQCALWCKGYTGGAEFGMYDASIGAAIMRVRKDMGFETEPEVSPKMMKSLFTMDAYIVIRGGSDSVRAVQQWMNHRYAGRADYFVVPCDGIFSRDVQHGLMLALQYEIGMADGVANGNFGPGTQSGITSSGLVSQGSSDGAKAFVRLFQAALIFNAFPTSFDGVFDSRTASVVRDFQSFVELPESGHGDFATWASLLVSTGDSSRSAAACDTSKPLTAATAALLKSAGYKTVGRYLSVTEKRYAPGELELIFAQGLSTFPIFQEWNNEASYFSEEKGFAQGVAAVKRARNLGFKAGTIIYFAVDYDATAEEIPVLMIPYFTGIGRAIESSRLVRYRVGVYGTRNLCTQVSAAGLSVASFVSGMSTGYSGNLGFRLPSDWAYDQVQEFTLGSGSTSLPVDKDVRSKRAEPVTSVLPTPVLGTAPDLSFDEDFLWRFGDMTYIAESHGSALFTTPEYYDDIVLQYIQRKKYWSAPFRAFSPLFEDTAAGSGASGDHVASMREAFEKDPSLPPLPDATSYGGDVEHFAASLRGYTTWGVPRSASAVWEGDLGAWALDLVTCFDDYVNARKSGFRDGARTFFAKNVGRPNTGTFDRADLIADMDAYLVAKMRSVTATRSTWDCLRDIQLHAHADGAWRPKQFFAQRFEASRANVESACRQLFNPQFIEKWIEWPVGYFSKTRLPGQPAISGEPALSASEQAKELDEVAAGFADSLALFCSDGLSIT